MADDQSLGRLLAATPTLALIAQLQTDRRIRDTRGLYFVEGVRNFVAAVDHHVPVEAVVYSERLLTPPALRKRFWTDVLRSLELSFDLIADEARAFNQGRLRCLPDEYISDTFETTPVAIRQAAA